jgi:transposase-like protein
VTRQSPYPIVLSPAERSVLEATVRRYTSPHHDVVRARIILMAADGTPNLEIAAALGIPRQLVSKWRKRYFEERLPGLADRPRPGRPRRPPMTRPLSRL